MASKTFNRLATKLSPWQKEQAEKYDQNTTLVYGFKYTFRDRYGEDPRVFVGTYVSDVYGAEFDEYDRKYRYYDDRVILVDGAETRIPTYFVGERVWD